MSCVRIAVSREHAHVFLKTNHTFRGDRDDDNVDDSSAVTKHALKI